MELHSPGHPTVTNSWFIRSRSSLSALTAAGWVSATGGLLWTRVAGRRCDGVKQHTQTEVGVWFWQSWRCSAPVNIGLNLWGLLSVKIYVVRVVFTNQVVLRISRWVLNVPHETIKILSETTQFGPECSFGYLKLQKDFKPWFGSLGALLDILKGSLTSLQEPRGSSVLRRRARHLVTAACGAAVPVVRRGLANQAKRKRA